MLSDILPQEAFGYILVLIRMSALIFLMPALGESSIPTNIRVYFALLLSLIVYPEVRSTLPLLPASPIGLVALIISELLVGIMMALSVRLLMSATHTAGSIIAFQSGLASAQSFDPSQGSQAALVASFLSLLAITLIFTNNLHHLMIMGFAHSYQKFPPGFVFPTADIAGLVTDFVAASFRLGLQLGAPFLAYGFVFHLAQGLLSKLVQGFQIFFVALPLNVFLGFALLFAIVGSIMNLFIEHFERLLLTLVG